MLRPSTQVSSIVLTQVDGIDDPLHKPPRGRVGFPDVLRQTCLYTPSSLTPALKFQPNKSACPFMITQKHDPRWRRGNFSGTVASPPPFSLPPPSFSYSELNALSFPPGSAWTPRQTLLRPSWSRPVEVSTTFWHSGMLCVQLTQVSRRRRRQNHFKTIRDHSLMLGRANVLMFLFKVLELTVVKSASEHNTGSVTCSYLQNTFIFLLYILFEIFGVQYWITTYHCQSLYLD